MKLGRWMCHSSSRFQKFFEFQSWNNLSLVNLLLSNWSHQKFKSWIIILYCLEIGCKWMDHNVSWCVLVPAPRGFSQVSPRSMLYILQKARFSPCWATLFQRVFWGGIETTWIYERYKYIIEHVKCWQQHSAHGQAFYRVEKTGEILTTNHYLVPQMDGVFCSHPLMIHCALVVFGAVLCFLNTFNSVYYPQTFNHPRLNFQSTLSSLVHVIAWFRLGFLQEIVLRQSDKFGQPLMEASLGVIDCWYFHTVHIFLFQVGRDVGFCALSCALEGFIPIGILLEETKHINTLHYPDSGLNQLLSGF